MRNLRVLVAVLSVLLLFAWGCGESSSEEASPAEDALVSGPVRGFVWTDEALVDATVELQTYDGRPVAGTARTGPDGAFEVEVDEVNAGLRVIVTGGSRGDEAFDGTLSAYLFPFDSDWEVFVTPVTTMADRLRLRGIAPADAERRLAAYLGLRPGRSIRSDFRFLHDFNSGEFMREARNRGFDAFVDEIVSEIFTDPEAHRSFSQDLLQAPRLASALGMELIKGAVGEVGGTLAGKLLASLGVEDAADESAKILRTLQEINQQLLVLQATVDEIAREVKLVQVNLATESAKEVIGFTRTTWKDVQNLAKLSGDEQERARRRTIDFIIHTLSHHRDKIADMLNAELSTADSPIQLYAEYLRDSHRFYSVGLNNRFIDFIEFYDAYNVWLHYLLFDALHSEALLATGKPSEEVPLIAEQFQAARNRYLQRLPPKEWPHSGMFIEIPTLRMWYASEETHGYPALTKGTTPHRNHVQDSMLPDQLMRMGGWRVSPTGKLNNWKLTSNGPLEGFRGGFGAIVARGAPAHIFKPGVYWYWVEGSPKDLMGDGTIHGLMLDVERETIIMSVYARLLAFRPMERKEVVEYWFPWLYPERVKK